MGDLTDSQRRIIASVENIGRVLYTGSGIAIAVIVIKLLTSQESLQISGVVIALGKVWVLFAAITVLHIFLAIFLVLEIQRYMNGAPPASDLRRVFSEVAAGSNLFVHGLISRATPRRPGGHIYRMHWSDPSTWIAHAAAIILIIALLPWRLDTHGIHWSNGAVLWQTVVLTVAVVVGNWWAGSIWLINVSELADLATWIESLPTGPVSKVELDHLVELARPMLRDGVRPKHRTIYEISNLLKRWANTPWATYLSETNNSRSFLGWVFRARKQESGISRSKLDQIMYIYSYFQETMPWLVAPNFHVMAASKEWPDMLDGHPTTGREEWREKWRKGAGGLIHLLLKGSSG